jgi:hypothetical protein
MVAQGRSRWIAATFAVVIIVVLVAGFLLIFPRAGPGTGCTPSAPTGLGGGQSSTLANCHTIVSMAPNSFVSYSAERLSDHESIVGQYVANTSTGGSLASYLLNSTDFGILLSHPHPTSPPANYSWTSGPGSECNVSIPVPGSPTQYYFVVENTGPRNFTIEWTQSLLLYYLPTMSY